MTRTARAFCLLAMLSISGQAFAETDVRQAAVRLTDAVGFAENARSQYQQQVARIMGHLQQSNPDLPGRAFDILDEEFETVAPKVVQAMQDAAIDMYVARFTTDELNQIAAFYESDVGKKALAEMQAIAASGASEGREIGERFGREAAGRALERMREEGISFGGK